MKDTKILCLHGFGKRRGRQFEAIREAFSDHFEILCPDYYELKKEDADADLWLKHARDVLDELVDDKLIVIGFSLGALIAAHFAREYSFVKMILLSPSLDDRNFLEVKKANPDPAVPEEFLEVFSETLKRCIGDVEEISCPVTLLHAKGDELIPYAFTEEYFDKIRSRQKKLYLLEGGSHVILDDPDTKENVMEILRKELFGGAYEKES